MATYDWDDPAIFAMVMGGHSPYEVWIDDERDFYAPRTFRGVVCDKDSHPWPCPTILEFRAEMERRSALAAEEMQAAARAGRDARIGDSARGVTPRA